MEINMKKKIISLILCITMLFSVASVLSSCGGGGGNPDALVIMTENLDGLFNPFYSTSASDGTIVSMTQIGMLTSKYDEAKKQAVVAYGDDQPVVVKDLLVSRDEKSDTTSYLFVLKNGIKFSDGKPLTMNDVLFNLYVYLDPVYTGSSTLYSTKILGLQEYRTQHSGDDSADDIISQQASNRANDRINQLLTVYFTVVDLDRNGTYAEYDEMYDKMIKAILITTTTW